eukprot:g13314.t1
MPDPASYRRELLLEKQLRRLTGLSGRQGLRPRTKEFYRQEEALQALEERGGFPSEIAQCAKLACERKQGGCRLQGMNALIQTGDYEPSQVSLFAQEVGCKGQRRFLVDTFANFAFAHAPPAWPLDEKPLGHFYEVILENRPCWLYFDLEFSKEANPSLDPTVVMEAFRGTLSAFCQEKLGMSLDFSSMVELESSTEKKFSRHVIVQRLLRRDAQQLNLAFANNAQAGLLVDTLVRYAEAHREEECIAQHLFVQAPSRGDEESRCTCVIDESVYSRNRSFRLLFQSKFGKDRRLDLDPKMEHVFFGGKPHPCVALLRTMASFVPDGTELFQHEIIPKEYSHRQLKASRMSRGGSVLIRKENGTMVTAHCDPLVHHLLRAWDEVRQLNEKDFREPAAATVVQSVVEMDNRYITVTLGNNHYCFCKGSSHLRNHVYLVVDVLQASFHQKCFDPDCRSFASCSFAIPSWIIESMLEEP